MNPSSSIILLYDSNNIKKSIFPSAAICKIGLVSDYLVIHPVIYINFWHTVQSRGRDRALKTTEYSVQTVWILLRGEKKVAFNILPPKCCRNPVWSRAGNTDMYVNLLLLNASANSHGEDLWTPLSPTPTSHQHSLLPCVSASLISHPTPSATSTPIWHPLPHGERPNIQFTPLHILTTLTDADWSVHIINHDTDSFDYKSTKI